MARYGSKYARRYRRYKRFYRMFGGSRRYGYSRKYVNATSKSSVRMKTNVTASFTAHAGYGNDCTSAQVYRIQPLGAGGVTDALSAANSTLYRTYCDLYEELKCIGVKVNLSVSSAIGTGDIPSLQIYSCWDRKFGNGEALPTVDQIKASATNTVATALNNNVAKLTRSCYASDLMEKATWFDSTYDKSNNNRNQAWYTAGLNPNMFCPSFQWFFNCPTLGEQKDVGISVSITYYFAFRNPRYGRRRTTSITRIAEGKIISDANRNTNIFLLASLIILPSAILVMEVVRLLPSLLI
uniref:Capsid protein n=1 Tax=Cressdnaviricota sp. TaxID=2748378 RepID=A0A8E7YZA3_9VIRU|nr:capsid protein [Cressdnaviricota sp.]